MEDFIEDMKKTMSVSVQLVFSNVIAGRQKEKKDKRQVRVTETDFIS